MKPARLRPLAEDDLVDRTRHYGTTAGADVAERFFDVAIGAVRSIEDMPGIGSPTVGELTGIDGLRQIGVEGFPCGWFYLERADHLDVIRLLADRQDLQTCSSSSSDVLLSLRSAPPRSPPGEQRPVRLVGG